MRSRASRTGRRSAGLATKDLLVEHSCGGRRLRGQVLGKEALGIPIELDGLASPSGAGKVEHERLICVLAIRVDFEHLLHEPNAICILTAIGTDGSHAKHR